jgi:hypothetical protein
VIRGVQLVFDCTDPDEIIRFWGRALGYDLEWVHLTLEEIREARKEFPQFDGRGRLDDPQGRRMPIYIQAVPEPKSGRNRVRLEVAVRDMGDALATFRELGATEGDDGELHDIEGNEFTLVEAELPEGVDRALRSILIDARDPVSMVCFWSQATGYEQRGGRCDPRSRSDGLLDLIPGIQFVSTAEPKRTKNRLHIDLHTSDAEAHQVQLRDLGATVQRWDTDHVMLDPEGNEFCVG